MSTWIIILMMLLMFVGGFAAYPFLYPQLKKLWLKVDDQVIDELEEQAKKLKGKLEHQVIIAKGKGIDISSELEDIYQDIEDLVKIIKR